MQLIENELVKQLFSHTLEERMLIEDAGTILFATRNAANRLGYNPAGLSGMKLDRILPEAIAAHLIAILNQSAYIENEIIRLDFIDRHGKHCPQKCSLFSLEDIDQKKFLLIHFLVDVDELKRKIELLTQRLELFEDTADNLPAIIWLQNRDGSKISYVNCAFEGIYGVPGQTLIDDSSSWLKFVHPDDLQKVSKIWLENTSNRAEIEFRVIRPDGATRWVIDTYIPIFNDNGDIIRKVGFAVDITALKLIQNELKGKETKLREQASELEKLNTALQVLVEHREKEIKDIDENLATTLARLVMPYIKSLQSTKLDRDQRVYLDILNSNLKKITSSFARRIAPWQSQLSAMETKVADMVLNGKTTKEISELLSISTATVGFHRHNIRKKLDIENKKINLQSHLRAIS